MPLSINIIRIFLQNGGLEACRRFPGTKSKMLPISPYGLFNLMKLITHLHHIATPIYPFFVVSKGDDKKGDGFPSP